jgi:hypothetical protein
MKALVYSDTPPNLALIMESFVSVCFHLCVCIIAVLMHVDLIVICVCMRTQVITLLTTLMWLVACES